MSYAESTIIKDATTGNSAEVVGNKLQVGGTVAVTGAGDASAANQTTEIARLTSILAQLDVALSTRGSEVTIAAILAKIIAAPATEALQTTGNTTLAAILAKIIAAPSTEAKQDTIITALNAIDAGIPAALGQVAMASSMPVTIASNQTAVPISGTVTVDTSLLATHAKQDTGNTSLSSIDTKTPALGQALAAASTPVVLTAAQVTTLTPQTNALTDAQLRATPVPTHDQVLDDVIGTVGAAAPSKVVLIGAIDSSGNVREPLLLNTNFDEQPATDIGLLTSDRLFAYNGTTWDRVKIDTSGNLQVSAVGDIAHDEVDSGNPVKIGGYANDCPPDTVENADRVNAWFTTRGALNTVEANSNLQRRLQEELLIESYEQGFLMIGFNERYSPYRNTIEFR